MYLRGRDDQTLKVSAFCEERTRNASRLQQLQAAQTSVESNGGMLCLANGDVLEVPVPSEHVLPFLAKEIEASKIKVAEDDQKMKQILEIIGS